MDAGDSFYGEHLSDYSDDFEEDESATRSNQPPPPPLDLYSTFTPRHVKQDSSFSVEANKTDPVLRKAKSQYMSGRKGSKMNRSFVKGKTRAASEMKTFPSTVKQGSMFSPRDRELSAKRHAIKRLENSLTETKRELNDLKKENRLLNRLQIRQEKEINRFQTQEGELPEILARHTEEVRALKEQLRRSQEASHTHQQKANDLHQELLRVNNRKKKLEEVAKRKHLLEREKLTLQLQDINEQLQGKERRISELERGIEAINKNHGQEVKSLLLKSKALSNENENLRNASQRLQAQLKEKEREMDVLNIYTQRLGKNMPPRISTRLQAPVTESIALQTELSCPPTKNVSLQTKMRLKSSSSQTDYFPPPKPPVSFATAITQTDIVDSPKNDNHKVSNSPQACRSGPQQTIIGMALKDEKAGSAITPTGGHKSRTETPSFMVSGEDKMNVEEQKKRELLAMLKAMDAQRDPPASQPIASSTIKSMAQPTSNVTVGVERPAVDGKMTKPPVQPPTSQPEGVVESDEEEAKKKKLLLAKLMAIDDGNDPNKVTMSKMDISKSHPSPKHSANGHKSTTSIQSWPETVENMYQGKPAFAADGDPFGSRYSSGKRTMSTKSKEFFITEGGGGEDSPKPKRLGRRHQLEQNRSSFFDSDLSTRSSKESSPPTAVQMQLGYQPTFGRRAGIQAASQKPKNGMIFGDLDNIVQPTAKKTEPPSSLMFNFGGDGSPRQETSSNGGDYPWETRVNVSSNSPLGAGKERQTEKAGPLSSPSMVFGYVGQPKPILQSRSRGSLLPLREKVATSSVIPGTVDVTEPDDLEELAL